MKDKKCIKVPSLLIQVVKQGNKNFDFSIVYSALSQFIAQ
jgi:hypothetical protein